LTAGVIITRLGVISSRNNNTVRSLRTTAPTGRLTERGLFHLPTVCSRDLYALSGAATKQPEGSLRTFGLKEKDPCYCCFVSLSRDENPYHYRTIMQRNEIAGADC
jgi:hypothetical protein